LNPEPCAKAFDESFLQFVRRVVHERSWDESLDLQRKQMKEDCAQVRRKLRRMRRKEAVKRWRWELM
jgi:hypothetical protein